jgi:succinate dehydrogenase flavin-adding protein (antitoxin of CptAB toxin-antitoxin module)
MPTIGYSPGSELIPQYYTKETADAISRTTKALDVRPPEVDLAHVMGTADMLMRVSMDNNASLEMHLGEFRRSVTSFLAAFDPDTQVEKPQMPPKASITLQFFLCDLRNSDTRILKAAGNIFMIALLREKVVDQGVIERLLALHRATEKSRELNKEQQKKLTNLLRKSDLQLLRLISLRDRADNNKAFLVDAKLISHLRADLSSDHPAQQMAVDGRMYMGGEHLKMRISTLMDSCGAGYWESLTILIGMCTGLPSRIVVDTPLKHGAHRPRGVFWLDVAQGVLCVDLRPVLDELGKAIPGTREHTSTLRLCLPQQLSRRLQEGVAQCPKATKLGDLHSTTVKAEDTESDDIRITSTLDEIADRATLIRSMAVHVARKSGQRALAGYAFLAFGLLTQSDIHYIAVPEVAIWGLRDEVFEELGLGRSVPQEGASLHVGSKRCLTATSVKSIFEELETQVENSRVQRRSSLQALVVFHNTFARYVCLLLHFAAGARRTNVVHFTASSWFAGSMFGYLDDKDTGVASSRTPLHIGPMTHLQLELWEAHLSSLAVRLGNLVGVRSKAATAHIQAILDKQDIPATFLLSDDGTPRPMTSSDLFVGRAEAINQDFGRHFFATELCEKNASLADIQGFLRHQGKYINAQCALGHETHVARMRRLATQCEEIMRCTGLHAVQGLSKGKK